jgi:two-component system, OmpR family, response regulator
MNGAHLDILCVDDDPDIRMIVALALGLDDHISVKQAGDGSEAMALLLDPQYQPDCILLDIKLPDIDGILLMGKIRRLPRIAETPVIFLTASVGAHYQSEVRSMGAKGLIAKPFDPVRLSFMVRSLMHSSVAPAKQRSSLYGSS